MLARLCGLMERICVSASDLVGLKAWIEVHAGLVGPSPQPPALAGSSTPEAEWQTSRSWYLLLNDESWTHEFSALDAMANTSANAASLLALRAIVDARFTLAVTIARQAVNLALAENQPNFDQVLAQWVLARAYRYAGEPTAALTTLKGIAVDRSGPWTAWVCWERLLAGGLSTFGHRSSEAPVAATILPTVTARSADALKRLLITLREQSRQKIQDAMAELERTVSPCPLLRREVEAFFCALDATREPISRDVRAWIGGEEGAVYCAFMPVAPSTTTPSSRVLPSAMILGGPDVPGRRFLCAGQALVPHAQELDSHSIARMRATTRTETGLAVLALAGPAGIACSEFFRLLYGIRFSPKRHQSILDVLCYRMRLLLGEHGEVHRPRRLTDPELGGEAKLCLRLNKPIALSDPRLALSTNGRILHVIATVGGNVSLSQIASHLRLPVRTVQCCVRDLVQTGQCVRVRDGRRIGYHASDPVPTLSHWNWRSDPGSPPQISTAAGRR